MIHVYLKQEKKKFRTFEDDVNVLRMTLFLNSTTVIHFIDPVYKKSTAAVSTSCVALWDMMMTLQEAYTSTGRMNKPSTFYENIDFYPSECIILFFEQIIDQYIFLFSLKQ